MYVCLYVCAGTLALPGEGIGSLVARVIGSFELSDVGAGTRTWVLWAISPVIMMTFLKKTLLTFFLFMQYVCVCVCLHVSMHMA